MVRRLQTRNVGEDATIALLCTDHPDAVFVTADKTASFVALAELGVGRVASPFCLFAHLREHAYITTDDFTELCDRTVRQLRQGIPGRPWRFRSAHG